jgi:8-oxo-dGTP pyrophosphatase MutT (NUDIX family)
MDTLVPHFVLGFMLTEDLKSVLLLKKSHPPAQKGKWNGLGGRVEVNDESIYAAMRREFKEEALGEGGETWVHFATLTSDYNLPMVLHCFAAKGRFNFPNEFFDPALREEPLGIWPVLSLQEQDDKGQLVANCLWLIFMARSILSGREHSVGFSVRELDKMASWRLYAGSAGSLYR